MKGVERVYAFSESERSILQDLGDLSSSTGLAPNCAKRLRNHHQLQSVISLATKQTGLRAKAMDIFNQTVAVKDVQRLDLFIRQHMLERQPWNDRVTKLLTHSMS